MSQGKDRSGRASRALICDWSIFSRINSVWPWGPQADFLQCLTFFFFFAECAVANMADIVFLVDGSSSIGIPSFKQVRLFLQSIVSGLDIGPDKVRVGLAQYSTNPHKEFLLKEHLDAPSLMTAIQKFPYRTGGTNTGKAINFLISEYFTEEAGSRASQRVPQIAVVITDGDSSDNVTEPARRLREQGVIVFAIGVGKANLEELENIANQPSQRFLFTIDSYEALQRLTGGLLQTVCVSMEDQRQGEAESCRSFCGASGSSFFHSRQTGRRARRGGKTCDCRAAKLADIVFIVDESGSITVENFQLVRSFLYSIISGLEINPNRVRVGIVLYNEQPTAQVYLNTFKQKTELLNFIKILPYRGGGTSTGAALNFTQENVFITETGSRKDKGVEQVAVVITDGESQDNVSQAAAELRRAGVTIYSVGVQNANEDELRQIASHPPQKHVFIVDSFARLKSLEEYLQKTLCYNIIRQAVSVSARRSGIREGPQQRLRKSAVRLQAKTT
uniref:VWFA domain-containing protein n=1 Tax=Xiphophorus couchianus TaxID=32473 RepID=A0A3B5MZT1_9TELE